MVQMVENLPVLWETQVRSLGQEDSLEEGVATYFSIFAWRIPWTEEPGSPWGRRELDMTEQLTPELQQHQPSLPFRAGAPTSSPLTLPLPECLSLLAAPQTKTSSTA